MPEEVIATGAIIIRTVMEMLGQSSMLVSDLGLREGVPIEMATRTRWVRRVGSNKQ
jgi:exopolyphosphatase/guanosine-5'-triphosphate,3'-diphosphate pyrophosphatase